MVDVTAEAQRTEGTRGEDGEWTMEDCIQESGGDGDAGRTMQNRRRVAHGKAVSCCLHTATRSPKRIRAGPKFRRAVFGTIGIKGRL